MFFVFFSLRKEYTEKHREIALLEARIYCLSELLGQQRSSTIDHVQLKQARTVDEREEDEEDVVNEESDEDDEDDEVVYNPKNLPLGWDGKVRNLKKKSLRANKNFIFFSKILKPIPYWLYKLHGLNLYFNCEICGNFRYRGPKEFQRHFSEWRHAHGMRCLGIPNTAHFANITSIEDAAQLWEKLRTTREYERFKPDVEVEFYEIFFYFNYFLRF